MIHLRSWRSWLRLLSRETLPTLTWTVEASSHSSIRHQIRLSCIKGTFHRRIQALVSTEKMPPPSHQPLKSATTYKRWEKREVWAVWQTSLAIVLRRQRPMTSLWIAVPSQIWWRIKPYLDLPISRHSSKTTTARSRSPKKHSCDWIWIICPAWATVTTRGLSMRFWSRSRNFRALPARGPMTSTNSPKSKRFK